MTAQIKNFFRKKRAFSLVELSVVVIVASIIIAGVLSVSVGKVSNHKVKVTNERLNEIYKALGSYVVANKRMPCPASIKAIKSSDSNYGVEGTAAGTCTAGTGVYSGGTNLVYGMVPVRTLGLKSSLAEDGFGGKIAYFVDKSFTDSSTFTSASGSITIQEYTNGALATVATSQMFALVSHGANQTSSFGSNSNAQNTVTVDIDEMSNDATTFVDLAKTAIFTNTLTVTTERSTVFDDIIFYKSRDNLLMDNNALTMTNPNISTTSNLK